MKRPDILEENALPLPDGFDFNVFLQASFRMYGVNHKSVELLCKNDVMDAILDKFGKETVVRYLDDEHFCVNVEVAPTSVFYAWVFGFGRKVEIIGPEEVRDAYREMVLKASEPFK